VSAASRLRYFYLAYLSKPKAQRTLYRLIRRHSPRNIVEIGVGDCQRGSRLIGVAQRFARGEPVQYTGIDVFEAAASRTLLLKEAYRRLRATAANIRLEPGDPHWALARAANSLTGTDLLVISSQVDAQSLAAAWFYVPRMLHSGSLVMLEEAADDGPIWRTLSQLEIAQLARPTARRQAA
jgi:hypothetical protein